jgi:hypothetical protein
MDDEHETERRSNYPVSRAKMSKTPSWIMLGFILGALFVVALPPLKKKTTAPEPDVALKLAQPPPPASASEPPRLTTIEDVFAEWGRHAIWSEDTTEVALWNIEKRAFADFYEVKRVNGVYYFRTIPRLTRRVINHGKPLPDSPLQFTETEEQYQEWLKYGRSERRAEQRDYRPAPPSSTTTRIIPPDMGTGRQIVPVLESPKTNLDKEK